MKHDVGIGKCNANQDVCGSNTHKVADTDLGCNQNPIDDGAGHKN